jgi:hypothetical protein
VLAVAGRGLVWMVELRWCSCVGYSIDVDRVDCLLPLHHFSTFTDLIMNTCDRSYRTKSSW